MKDEDCIRFLQWALPECGYDWPGFRKVRRTVCRRLKRRLAALEHPDFETYRKALKSSPEEWGIFDRACRIPISRFARDREVFARLGAEILPMAATAARARGARRLRCWSAGCAMGQEPYSLALLWRERLARSFPDLQLRIVATDVDEANLARASAGCYRTEALRGLPEAWRALGFTPCDGRLRVRSELRAQVAFAVQDIRREMPDGPFDVILCRNLAFTYFAREIRIKLLERLADRLQPGGALVLGRRESLPAISTRLRQVDGLPIFLKQAA